MFQSESFISVSETDLTVNIDLKEKEAAIPTSNKLTSIKLFFKKYKKIR